MKTATGARPRNEDLVLAETMISYVLRYGVLLSAALLLVGVLLLALHPSGDARKFELSAVLHPSPPYKIADLYAGVKQGDPDTWLAAGLLLLIGLPILRVGLTVVLFLLERDKIYLTITLIVLTVLLSGIFFGKAL